MLSKNRNGFRWFSDGKRYAPILDQTKCTGIRRKTLFQPLTAVETWILKKFLEILISVKKWPLGCSDRHTSLWKVFDSFFYYIIDSEKNFQTGFYKKISFFTTQGWKEVWFSQNPWETRGSDNNRALKYHQTVNFSSVKYRGLSRPMWLYFNWKFEKFIISLRPPLFDCYIM